jgi:hypothetical protein
MMINVAAATTIAARTGDVITRSRRASAMSARYLLHQR